MIAPPPLPAHSGWVVFWNPASVASFRAHADKLTEVMPEWTMVAPDGTALRRPEFRTERVAFAREAKARGVRVLGMASNYVQPTGFDPKRMTLMLATPTGRKIHAAALARIVREDGLDGVDLDYESLVASDRENFSLFAEELDRALKGKTLSVTLHPKAEEPGGWDGPRAQDYVRIGRAADVVRIMAYDQHGPWSDFGPVAADLWAETIMRFAASLIPPRKLEIGVAAYGYDWGRKPAASLVYPDLPLEGRTTDPASGEIVVGKATFGGTDSLRRKREIAARLGLRGTSQWYIGSEEPAMWGVLPSR